MNVSLTLLVWDQRPLWAEALVESDQVKPETHSHELPPPGKKGRTHLCSCMLFLRPTEGARLLLHLWIKELQGQPWTFHVRENEQSGFTRALNKTASQVWEIFWTLSFEVVPVSEAALVNSGWASYQILDINLPFLWAWILLPSKVSMWIFLCNLIDIYYSLSPHIICEVSWMLWRWQVHDICQGQPCVQSENGKKRKLSEDISATFPPTIQQMEEHMHQWDEDPY
jgi:hypothetical protein